MAFIKKDWKCGDTITADDLNRLENGVEEALDGGSVDCGYSCSEGWVTLTDESVTTTKANEEATHAIGEFTYSERITADTIKVTFNGTEYTCNKVVMMGGNYYGGVSEAGPDFSEYPFAITSTTDPSGVLHNTLITETTGTYQVKIEALEETIETSECFDKARGYSCIESVTTYVDETVMFS